MKFFDKFKSLFRGYSQLVRPAEGTFANWPLDSTTEEQDLHNNHQALHGRMDSLTRENATFTKYHWTLMASVFSESGLMLRLPITEDEDREIDAKEKAIVRRYEDRWNRVLKWNAREGKRFMPMQLTRESDEDLTRMQNGSGKVRKATLKAGSPDLAASQLIIRKWNKWQEAQYCDLRGQSNHQLQDQILLWTAVRRGEIFVRMISDPTKRVNKFGFALQLINPEWCDRFYNGTLPNGNTVQQGIECEKTPWGTGNPVAYYFIEKTPADYRWALIPGMSFGNAPAAKHTRILASEIIHYKRATDADTMRPGPWAAASIPTAKHLQDYASHAVVAAREACMRLGWLESTLTSDASEIAALSINKPSDTAKKLGALKPGSVFGLPPFNTYKTNSPEHPTSTFSDFFNSQGRLQSSAMPGSSYSELFNDYAAITFSSGKLEGLTRSATIYLMQDFHIKTASIPIFRRWLEMALLVGEIPLPLAKLDKFCVPFFQGPKMPGVDEVKDGTAAAFRIANHLSSWSSEAANIGYVFEDEILVKAENKMLLEQLGMNTETVSNKPMPVNEAQPASEQVSTAAGSDKEELGYAPRF